MTKPCREDDRIGIQHRGLGRCGRIVEAVGDVGEGDEQDRRVQAGHRRGEAGDAECQAAAAGVETGGGGRLFLGHAVGVLPADVL